MIGLGCLGMAGLEGSIFINEANEFDIPKTIKNQIKSLSPENLFLTKTIKYQRFVSLVF